MSRYEIERERSRVWCVVKATIQQIEVEATRLEGAFEVEMDGDGRIRSQPPPTGRFTLGVADLESGNRLFDIDLRRTIQARKFPQIVGELKGVEPLGDGGYRVQGSLRLHGHARPVEGTVRVRSLDDERVSVEGSMVLTLEDFGIRPRRMLVLRVMPELTVAGSVVARRAEGRA